MRNTRNLKTNEQIKEEKLTKKGQKMAKLRQKHLQNRKYVFGTNLFQFLFSTWTSALFEFGQYGQLDKSLIPELQDKHKTKNQFKVFKNILESRSAHTNPPTVFPNKSRFVLFQTIFQFMKKQIILFLMLSIIIVGLQIYSSILSYQIISYFGEGSRIFTHNIKYFFIFVVVNFFLYFVNSFTLYVANIKGIMLSNVINLAISDKMFRYPLLSCRDFQISEIINYSQVDAAQFQLLCHFFTKACCSILHFLAGAVLLYFYIGISFLIGIGILAVFLFLSLYLFNVIARKNQQLFKAKDERIKVIEQILHIIKFIKVNVLEEHYLQKVSSKRQYQLSVKKKLNILNAANKLIHCLCSPIVFFVTIFGYISFGNQINTGKVFLAIIIFKQFQITLQRFPSVFSVLINCWTSTKRLQKFLFANQLNRKTVKYDTSSEEAIMIEDGNFLWQKNKQNQKQSSRMETQDNLNSVEKILESKKDFFNQYDDQNNADSILTSYAQLCMNNKKYLKIFNAINLQILKNQTTMIIGEIGSGKSSLFYAILNEMMAEPNHSSSITISGQIAFCPQKTWIMNGTVKENIIFYQPYNENKLKEAIHYSCLAYDISIMNNGVETQIGEKGINLSGGQKARISLARALYSNKDIYLFDDIFSALDVHVGKFILQNTINKYLRGKTIVMSTHWMGSLEKADKILIMNKGEILLSGSYEQIKKAKDFQQISKISSILQQQSQFQKSRQQENAIRQLKHMNEVFQKQNQINESADIGASDIKKQSQEGIVQQLIIPQTQQKGQVSSRIYFQFIKLNGGKLFVIILLSLMAGSTAFFILSSLQISKFTQSEQLSKNYLYFYLGFTVISGLFAVLDSIYLLFCQMKQGRNFNKTIMKSIVYAGLNQFFARVPLGRIINRLSKDLKDMDELTNTIIDRMLTHIFNIMGSFIMSIYVSSPISLIPIGFVMIIWLLLLNYFIKAQRQCVRLEKTSNSPVASTLSQYANGMSTIRAYNLQKQFLDNHTSNIDSNKRIKLTRQSMQYWFEIRVSLFSLIVIYSIFGYCIFQQNQNASEIGLFLAFSCSLVQEVQYFLYWFVQLRLKMISVQRLVSFTKLDPQVPYRSNPELIKNNQKIAEGIIQFKNYSTRYRNNLPLSLKNISLIIQPHKKIGIVGRTGAGKSTLLNSLLRILQGAEGEIIIDRKNIINYDIKELRNSITMIQQEPTLMNASFRQNLDPVGEYDDKQIVQMLRQCRLLDLIDAKGGLSSIVTNSSISVGEKQLICICRALLKKSPIILIDEATANIDFKNDQLIQEVIKKAFKDSTVLTIAHRISTLKNCDKILVLNQGQIAQYGEVQQLMGKPESIYRKMCLQNDNSYLK